MRNLKTGLVLFIVLFSSVVVESNTWRHKQLQHKSRQLTTSKLKRVATLSNKNYFKNTLLKPLLRTRVSGTEGNRLAREHIINTVQSFGWTIEEDDFYSDTPLGNTQFVNIIATHRPELPRRLTLACHYDSKYFKNEEFIGATDSAVPCAMLLDLARSLNNSLWTPRTDRKSEAGVRPSFSGGFSSLSEARYQSLIELLHAMRLHNIDMTEEPLVNDLSLQFIFFDGEEAFHHWTDTDSLYGARHLAAKMGDTVSEVERELHLSDLERMDVMVLLDLIGVKDPKFHNWFPETRDLFDKFKKIEKRLVDEKLLIPTTDFIKSNRYFKGEMAGSGGIQDDHIPFLNKGVRVLHLIAYPFPDAWHTTNDSEAILDYDTINNLNIILRTFVAEYLHLNP